MNSMAHGQVITVEHEARDGWHQFTCLQVPGLFLLATDADLEQAYTELPAAIADIIEADEGVEMVVELENSYSQYLAKLPETMRPAVRHYSIKRAA